MLCRIFYMTAGFALPVSAHNAFELNEFILTGLGESLQYLYPQIKGSKLWNHYIYNDESTFSHLCYIRKHAHGRKPFQYLKKLIIRVLFFNAGSCCVMYCKNHESSGHHSAYNTRRPILNYSSAASSFLYIWC